jgi:branched-chain amino acid transport system substrate-binding protein
MRACLSHLKPSRWAQLAALAVAVVALAGCGSSSSSSSTSTGSKSSDSGSAAPKETAKGPIIIGLATSDSGWLSVYDKPAVTAAEVARDEINAKGGINGRQIEFVKSNAQSDPSRAAAAALELIGKGAQFLIVTCDYDIGSPAARIAQTKNVVSIALCASAPQWNQIGPLSYSMSMGSITEAAVNAKFAYEDKGCKNGYILTDTTSAYTQQLSDYLPKYFKGKIVGKDTFKNGDSSFASQVSRIQSQGTKPDCIFMETFPPGGVTLLRELRAAGITQPIISPDGMDGDFWIKGVPNLKDFYFSAYASIFGDSPNADVNKLVAEIAKREGTKRITGSTAITGYAIMEALEKAITTAGSTDAKAVAGALDKFNAEPLIVGPTTFTSTSHLSLGRPMAMIQVQNGKYSFLKTVKADVGQ